MGDIADLSISPFLVLYGRLRNITINMLYFVEMLVFIIYII